MVTDLSRSTGYPTVCLTRCPLRPQSFGRINRYQRSSWFTATVHSVHIAGIRTREVESIMRFIEGNDLSSGSGKTWLMRSLGQICKDGAYNAASLFFARNEFKRNNEARLVIYRQRHWSGFNDFSSVVGNSTVVGRRSSWDPLIATSAIIPTFPYLRVYSFNRCSRWVRNPWDANVTSSESFWRRAFQRRFSFPPHPF